MHTSQANTTETQTNFDRLKSFEGAKIEIVERFGFEAEGVVRSVEQFRGTATVVVEETSVNGHTRSEPAERRFDIDLVDGPNHSYFEESNGDLRVINAATPANETLRNYVKERGARVTYDFKRSASE